MTLKQIHKEALCPECESKHLETREKIHREQVVEGLSWHDDVVSSESRSVIEDTKFFCHFCDKIVAESVKDLKIIEKDEPEIKMEE
jgi:hypothetical protein